MYGSYAIPTPDDGALYHYTRFENLLKILDSMTLRTSSLRNLNDLNEACIDGLDWNSDFALMYEVHDYIKDQFSIISFSKNYTLNGLCEEGSNHPAMWSHYADDSNGACIVLDKDAFIENNRTWLDGLFHKLEKVDYFIHNAPRHGIEYKQYSDASDFAQRNYRELFYKKHVDWQYEEEERFLVESPVLYLDIMGSIKHIVLGGRLSHDSAKLQEMLQLIITPGNKCYRYFDEHSFAEMVSSDYGYLTADAAYVIRRELNSMACSNDLARRYIEWQQNDM